jgi:hypothetical protein
MFCPNCGKGDQAPDSYCRSCGEFLTDFPGKSYLLNKMLGGSTPDTQVTVNLTINVVTILVSALLMGFLRGFYDAQYDKTGEATPWIIYPVYVFLGLVLVWQLLSLLINMRLRKKLSGRRKGVPPAEPAGASGAAASRATQRSLPRADYEGVVPASVAEGETKMLENRRGVGRDSGDA